MNTLSSAQKYCAIEKFSAVALPSLFLVQIYFLDSSKEDYRYLLLDRCFDQSQPHKNS